MVAFEEYFALIIDDDDVSIDVLSTMLSRLNMPHAYLQNSSEIEAYLETAPHLDAIFLDLEMPGMNGYQVLSVLKAHPKSAEVPIVAYTTHVSHANDAYAAGFHSFLGKPLDRTAFPQQLANILSGEAVWNLP